MSTSSACSSGKLNVSKTDEKLKGSFVMPFASLILPARAARLGLSPGFVPPSKASRADRIADALTSPSRSYGGLMGVPNGSLFSEQTLLLPSS
eukprot:scaffold31_cov263-Pinguiococcus_pyrenoidosus.AAC.55